ncbi:hypothetical protein [Sporosarcina limicola]|uniref:Uncharacterized protein n=1 Tax=Sporosarcina limicola TaxID=34101 RepID=A0A927MNR5_9BACL|nr:hypothetical protein [Sporosarcina limicola]MBE1554814.1 hypothetical protein [Sporosarcina limicola]
MAYIPTDWKNREVERPRTFTIQDNPDGTKTLIPAEGVISEPGTPIMATNMNNIEGELVILDAHLRDTNNPHKVTSFQVNVLELVPTAANEPTWYPSGISTGQANPESGFPGWGSITHFNYAGIASGCFQIYSPHSWSYGTELQYRMWAVDVGWTPFKKIVSSELPERIPVVLGAGWTNFSNSYEPLNYYKDSFGVVYVTGMISAVDGAPNLVTTLPEGYRPFKNALFYGQKNGDYASELMCRSDGQLLVTGLRPMVTSVNMYFRTR